MLARSYSLAPGELSATNVVTYLVGRRVIGRADEVTRVVELGAGVSNTVLAVEAGLVRVVVKQALPRLRVADEWLADPRRAITEGRAIERWCELLPGKAADVLDRDDDGCIITIRLAPPHWRSWRDLLASGEIEDRVASELGQLLATWHGAATNNHELLDEYADPVAFAELRLSPYHETMISRLPAMQSLIKPYLDRLRASRRTLIHGDYSPKNVLTGPEGLWVIDFEVANVGEPAFDVAFMIHHLLVEAILQPDASGRLLNAAEAFWRTYFEATSADVAPTATDVIGHSACLLLARVDGKSPIPSLQNGYRPLVRRAVRRLLEELPATLGDLWAGVQEAA